MTGPRTSKAGRLATAHVARKWGYRRPTPGTLSVTCPLCREQLTTDYSMHALGGSVTRHLDRMVVDHLDGECPGVPS